MRMLPDRRGKGGLNKKKDIKIKIQWKKRSSARPFSHSRNALTFVGSKSPDLFMTLVCSFVIIGIL